MAGGGQAHPPPAARCPPGGRWLPPYVMLQKNGKNVAALYENKQARKQARHVAQPELQEARA